MRFYFFLVLFFTLCLNMSAQDRPVPFTLNGKINADTGTVRLLLAADSGYYSNKGFSLIAKVSNGEFSIKGVISYPQPFYLRYEKGYFSDQFFIEPGIQSIMINIDSDEEVPKVDNSIMKEYQENYLPARRDVDIESARLRKKYADLVKQYHKEIPKGLELEWQKEQQANYKEGDKFLLRYSTANPNSYIAFWNLARLLDFGYQDIFDPILSKLSDSLKNTEAGQLLKSKISRAGVLGMGKVFPLPYAVDKDNLKLTNASVGKNQYTLIDFWYSGCSPCRATFPGLRAVYEKYRNSGFEIIGISIDKEAHRNDWLQVIAQDKLLWPQYLDLNGVETEKLSIRAFPTNFLLNNEGVIVGYNVKDVELADFLQKNIKK